MKKAICLIMVVLLLAGCGETRLINQKISKIKVDYYSILDEDFVITEEDEISSIVDYINAIDCEKYEDYEIYYGSPDKLIFYDGQGNEIGAVFTMNDQLWVFGQCYKIGEEDGIGFLFE